MSKKKKDNDIVVSCVGSSISEVTGSCWTISYKKNDGNRGLVVIECGLGQGEVDVQKAYNLNKKMINNIGKDVVQSAEYVLLGHAHIDHIGNLPYFNEDNGFNGKILGSKGTIQIGKELIKDSVFIHNKNIEYLKANKGKKLEHLYTEPQMYQMFNYMEEVFQNEEIVLNDNLSVVFHSNNHVLGASAISVYIKKPNQHRKHHILYSSDMGCKITQDLQPFISDLNLPKKCDLFISEATYNNKERQIVRKQAIEEREKLKRYIKQSLHEGKRILMATFSAYRCQLLLSLFYDWWGDEDWFKEFPVVVDGMLSNKINDVYLNILEGEDKEYFKKVLSMKNLNFNRNYDGTKAFLGQRTPSIVLAGSGFLTAGRITTYLPIYLGCSKDIIILTGYCGAEGSLGYKLLDENQKTITIDKRVVLKRSEISQLKTFSSHISYLELLELFSEMRCNKILIHHSDEKGKYEFINEAKEYMREKGVTTPLIPVNKGANQFVI